VFAELTTPRIASPPKTLILQATSRDGLFALEAETSFELLQHFDDADELVRAEDLLVEQEALMPDPRLASTVRHARRLRASAAASLLNG